MFVYGGVMPRQNQGRGRTKLSPATIKETERRRQALELRKGGVHFQVIAEQLGYPAAGNAYRAIMKALKATLQEPADEVRALELERLDRMLLGVWSKAVGGDLKAIDRVLRIMERRAMYLGLDSPQKMTLAGDPDHPFVLQPVKTMTAILPPDSDRAIELSDYTVTEVPSGNGHGD